MWQCEWLKCVYAWLFLRFLCVCVFKFCVRWCGVVYTCIMCVLWLFTCVRLCVWVCKFVMWFYMCVCVCARAACVSVRVWYRGFSVRDECVLCLCNCGKVMGTSGVNPFWGVGGMIAIWCWDFSREHAHTYTETHYTPHTRAHARTHTHTHAHIIFRTF